MDCLLIAYSRLIHCLVIAYWSSALHSRAQAGESAMAEVDESDFNAFIAEDWHVTHLGGRWRQSMHELNIVVTLPRRPKASELKVQIRTDRLWVLLQIPG